MRLNADTTLTSLTHPSTRLVPYTARHVPTYHAWMEDEALRAATGSERLTAAEEGAMCDAWREDGDKLTFIVLDAEVLAGAEAGGVPRRDAELAAMVGDVNLFLLEGEEEEEGGEGEGVREEAGAAGGPTVGEIEIMVAVPGARGRGHGAAAVRLLLSYAAARVVGLRRVVAKVKRGNAASISLFTSRLGFRVDKEVAVFDEVHLVAELGGEGCRHPALLSGAVVVEGRYGEWLDGGQGR